MQTRPILLALLSALLFGAATPASKVLLDGFTPFQLAGLLYLGAALAVALPALAPWRDVPTRSQRSAQSHSPLWRRSSSAAFSVRWRCSLACVLLRPRQSPSGSIWSWWPLPCWACSSFMTISAGAAGWASPRRWSPRCWSPGDRARPAFWPGALVLLACVCWGLDNHLTALIDGITPAQSTLWKGIVAGSVNLAIGLLLAPMTAAPGSIVLALLVGAFSYGASITLYIRAAQEIGATRAQVIFASAPFFGVALSVLLLGEAFSWIYALATPLFLVGIGLLLADSHAHDHGHSEVTHEHAHSHNDGHHTHAHDDLPSSARHNHPHTHQPLEHAHPHWPDLHHRHGHASQEQS